MWVDGCCEGFGIEKGEGRGRRGYLSMIFFGGGGNPFISHLCN